MHPDIKESQPELPDPLFSELFLETKKFLEGINATANQHEYLGKARLIYSLIPIMS